MWSVTVTGDHAGSETMLRHYIQTLQLQGWVVQVVPTGAENIGFHETEAPPTPETELGREPHEVHAAVEGAD